MTRRISTPSIASLESCRTGWIGLTIGHAWIGRAAQTGKQASPIRQILPPLSQFPARFWLANRRGITDRARACNRARVRTHATPTRRDATGIKDRPRAFVAPRYVEHRDKCKRKLWCISVNECGRAGGMQSRLPRRCHVYYVRSASGNIKLHSVDATRAPCASVATVLPRGRKKNIYIWGKERRYAHACTVANGRARRKNDDHTRFRVCNRGARNPSPS